MATAPQIIDFVNTFYSPVKKYSAETGIPFPHAISQIALESAYGTAAPGFNFMGIKARKDSSGKPIEPANLRWTWERVKDRNEANKFPERKPDSDYQKGGYWYIRVKDYFKAFANPEEAIKFYFNLLQKNRYLPALEAYKQGGQTWPEYTKAIVKAGYATTAPDSYAAAASQVYDRLSNFLPTTNKGKATGAVIILFLLIGAAFYYGNKQTLV